MQDILIHQKTSNLVNSLLLTYATSVNVWDSMVSYYNVDYISRELIGQKCPNDSHARTLISSTFWYYCHFFKNCHIFKNCKYNKLWIPINS